MNPEITPMAVKQRPLEEGCGILSPDFDIPVGNMAKNDNVLSRIKCVVPIINNFRTHLGPSNELRRDLRWAVQTYGVQRNVSYYH